jgi:hypothetical protein
MSEDKRLQLIAEIESKLEEFLSCEEFSTERKTAALRKLLEIATTEE